MAPSGHTAFELADGVTVPDDFAGRGVETIQMAHGAEGVNAVGVDRRRRARPVAIVHLVVIYRVLAHPALLARSCIEAGHALDFARFRLPIHDIDAPAGD